MEILYTVLAVILAAAVCVLAGWLFDPARASRGYDRAMAKDAEYARTHPGCSYEEAHRNRDRYYRRHGM